MPLSLLTAADKDKDKDKEKEKEKDKPASTHTISEFKLGPTLSGEEIKMDQMKGKVVALVYWGQF
ncbi:MAG: hypothetical protein ACR2OZ_14195 [Verrucomicrobiales bacterium]